jgi:hypothetical protein
MESLSFILQQWCGLWYVTKILTYLSFTITFTFRVRTYQNLKVSEMLVKIFGIVQKQNYKAHFGAENIALELWLQVQLMAIFCCNCLRLKLATLAETL